MNIKIIPRRPNTPEEDAYLKKYIEEEPLREARRITLATENTLKNQIILTEWINSRDTPVLVLPTKNNQRV